MKITDLTDDQIKVLKEYLKADDFLGSWDLCKRNVICHLFHSRNPDITKDHKNYPFVFNIDSKGTFTISALTDDQLFDLLHTPHVGVICPKCDQKIISKSRHDFITCDCGSTHVDGGFDYLKTDTTQTFKYNIITKEIK